MFNRFVLCFFDVLGFETRFSELGLAGILERYVELTRVVDDQNKHMLRLFEEMEFTESAYWTAERDAFIFSRMYGAYASDSILIWANADFPAARYPAALDLAPEERTKRAADPSARQTVVPTATTLPARALVSAMICARMLSRLAGASAPGPSPAR